MVLRSPPWLRRRPRCPAQARPWGLRSPPRPRSADPSPVSNSARSSRERAFSCVGAGGWHMLRQCFPPQEALLKKPQLLLALFAVFLALATAPASAQNRSVWIDDLTWVEVRDAIAGGKTTAIIFVGSSEQNGPHMAIGKHNFIARYCPERIAGQLGDALVYPVIPFAITGDAATKTAHMPLTGS